jgi:hypothetical protein
VGSPHVRVGHRQASNPKPRQFLCRGFFIFAYLLGCGSIFFFL